MEQKVNRLAGDFRGIELVTFALPTMIMMVFQGLYTIVDTFFVSWFVSTDALGAINVVTPVISLTVGVGTMFAAGGNAVIARSMGEGRNRQAKEEFTLIGITGMAVGMAMAIVIRIWLKEALLFLGAEGRLFVFAKEYLTVLLFFLPAYMLQTIFANLFVTAGRPGLGSGLAIGAGILNIILDYMFIVVLGLGIRGAAFGTGIGATFVTAAGIVFFGAHRRGTLYFVRPRMRIRVLAESCVNGSSEMVGQLSGAVTTLLFNLSGFRLAGENGVAAITILNYSQFLFHTIYIGFSMGTAPVIGYAYGSGDFRRQTRIIGSCVRFIAAASGCVFLISFFGGPAMVRIFAGGDGAVYLLAAEGIRIVSFGFLFSGFNLFVSSMFTALSNGKVSAFLSFVRTFVLLAAAILILPKFLGITGVWLAVPAAEFAACIVSGYVAGRHTIA